MTDDALSHAYRTLLHPEGEAAALIWADLARVCHAAETTFVPGDPAESAFREGKRAMFLYLAGRLAVPLTPRA